MTRRVNYIVIQWQIYDFFSRQNGGDFRNPTKTEGVWGGEFFMHLRIRMLA